MSDIRTTSASVLTGRRFRLGESPFYIPETGIFSWVDILDGKFYLMTPSGDISCHDAGQQIGALVPATGDGRYIVAGKAGLYLFDNGDITPYLALGEHFRSYQRSNDSKADPMGRLWFGSSVDDDAYPESGNLFRYDGMSVKIMQPDTLISNGMAWNSRRDRFYFSDSSYHAVFSYDYDNETGDISGRRVLFEVTNGVPDGMTIDSDDNLWVAIWGGRRIEKRDSVSGELLEIISVDAQNVTSCCFYGDNMDKLFITTSGEGLEGANDGKLFTCNTTSRGLFPDRALLYNHN
ncbi:MAG: SMP-30/gluconolactonase/LRE family protein [Clostridiales bacterium]|nr:SMP-30/gluconolactonase/LRE family protein [Clostridiales bacterium]